MKPDETDKDAEVEPPPCSVAGDPIGSTVYSERFVLRLLLKLSDLPGDEAALEEDLCVLWDMTAERDVVEFLLQHNFIEHARFAWPRVPSARIAEIFLGILANMCCYPAAVNELRTAQEFCSTIVQLVHSDDTLLLVQVLRLIKACLYDVNATEAERWLNLFATTDFPPALAFILTNSSNKELLNTALEVLNIVCSTCNVESTRIKFVEQFVTSEVVDGVHECVQELGVTQRDTCDRDELERSFLVSLEVSMNLAGFDTSHKLYEDKKDKICDMMATVLEYYKAKTVEDKDTDVYLIDIIDSVNAISDQLCLHKGGNTETCVMLAHSMWSGLCSSGALKLMDKSGFEETAEDIGDVIENLSKKLGLFVSRYLEVCPDEKFGRALEVVVEEWDDILSAIDDDSLRSSVTNRANDYRTRFKDN